jgi:TrmH family RNA methyltransferase
MRAIDSPANAAFRSWLRLATQPREAVAQGRSLAEGLHLAEAAASADVPVEAVLLRRGRRAAEVERRGADFAGRGAGVFELAAELYDRISPVQHGVGLMLVVTLPRRERPARLSRDLVYLDGVQDPGNAGTLLRTTAAAGIGTVLASPATAALWAPKTLRAGQGAQFRLRIHEQVAPAELPVILDGDWIGADAAGGEPLWTTEIPVGPIGWIFGAEGSGLSPGARAICRHRVVIPLDSAVESLNVAAAAAVCLFERRRRLLASL